MLFELVPKMARLPPGPDESLLRPLEFKDGRPPVRVIVTDFGPLDLEPGRRSSVGSDFVAPDWTRGQTQKMA